MGFIFAERPTKRPFTKKDHTLKTFFLYRAYKTFRDCVAGGCPWGTTHGINAFSLEEIPKGRSKLPITIHNQVFVAYEKTVKIVG